MNVRPGFGGYSMVQKEAINQRYGYLFDLWKALPINYQRRTYSVLALTLIGTFLEVLGLGVVLPAITVLVDPEVMTKHETFIPIFTALGIESQSDLLISGLLLIVVVYVTKAVYLAFLSLQHARYIYGIKAVLSDKLFAQYIYSPYETHLNRNSGHLIRNLTTEIQHVVSQVLNPIVLLVSEVAVLFAFVSVVLFYDPIGSLIAFSIITVSVLLFQKYTKTLLAKWGNERQVFEGVRIQKAQEGIGGIRDIILFGGESNFIEQYSGHNVKVSNVELKQNALSKLPRLWLESVGVSSIVLVVLVAIWERPGVEHVLPTIGLFAAAAFRLLPSATRILSSLQSVGYAGISVQLIIKELSTNNRLRSSSDEKLEFNEEIELQNVCFKYDGATIEALSDVTLNIRKGE